MVSSRAAIELFRRTRILQVLGIVDILDAHQPDQIRRGDEMVDGMADQSLHALHRRQVPQVLILLLGTQVGIDALEHRKVKRILGAEIVIDQVLVDAARLPSAIIRTPVRNDGGISSGQGFATRASARLPERYPVVKQLNRLVSWNRPPSQNFLQAEGHSSSARSSASILQASSFP